MGGEDIGRRVSVTQRLNIRYVHTFKLQPRTYSYSDSSIAARLAANFCVYHLSAKAGGVGRTRHLLAGSGISKSHANSLPCIIMLSAYDASMVLASLDVGEENLLEVAAARAALFRD